MATRPAVAPDICAPEWFGKTYVFHIDVIDAQHAQIANLMEALRTLINSGRSDAMSLTLNELFRHVIEHFKTEEKFMRQWAYPGLDAHKAEHDEFLELCDQLRYDWESRQTEPTTNIADVMIQWLTDHLEQNDRLYCSYAYRWSGLNNLSLRTRGTS